MVASTDRQGAEDEGRGKRRRPRKPTATPDQSGENTQDMAHDNGNKPSDGLYRAPDLIPDRSETPHRPERTLLTIKEVTRITGLCSSSIYAMLNRGDFPLPLVLGERRRRWDSDEIYGWMDSRPRGRGDLGRWMNPPQVA